MDEIFFTPLLEQALRVAAVAHRGQNRKASHVPYITHPAGVALILSRAGFCDEGILAAAVLHDVVEDTNYSIEQLTADFPAEIVQWVSALTERKRDEQGNKRSWRDRKLEHIDKIRHAPLQARAIMLADKLHNLSTMVIDLKAGEELWSRFNASPEEVIWYHQAIVAGAAGNDERLQPLAGACLDLLHALSAATERAT